MISTAVTSVDKTVDKTVVQTCQALTLGIGMALALRFLLAPRVELGALNIAAAASCIITGVLAGSSTLLPVRWQPSVVSTIALAGLAELAMLKELHGFAGAWTEITIMATVAVAVAGLALSRRWTAVVTAMAIVAVTAPALRPAIPDNIVIAEGLPWVLTGQLIATAALATITGALLRRSAQRADAELRCAADAQLRAAAVKAEHRQSDEAARVLHDTALNTLEAIAQTGAGLKPASLRSRCQADSSALRQLIGKPDSTCEQTVTGHLRSVVDRATLLGLDVTLDLRVTGEPPATVAAATAAATNEALLNVSKHANTASAQIVARMSASAARITVTDEGCGIAVGNQPGRGIACSIVERMRDIDGHADICSRGSGNGTQVVLRWNEAARGDATLRPVTRAMTWVALVICGGVGLIQLAATAADWSGFERPGLAVVTNAVVIVWTLHLLFGLIRGRGIDPVELAAAIGLSLAAVLLNPVADPYCSAWSNRGPLMDGRVVLMAVAVVCARRRLPLAIGAIGAYVLTGLGSALIWHQHWPTCVTPAMASTAAAAACLGTALVFGRTFDRYRSLALAAHHRALRAQREIVEQTTIARQRENWISPAVNEAQAILAEISCEPALAQKSAIRDRCRNEAVFLRNLLVVPSADSAINRVLRAELISMHARGIAIIVRGDFETLSAGNELERCLTTMLSTVSSAATRAPDPITVFAYSAADRAGITLNLRCADADWPAIIDVVGLRLAGADVEDWTDEQGYWLDLGWPRTVDSAVGATGVG